MSDAAYDFKAAAAAAMASAHRRQTLGKISVKADKARQATWSSDFGPRIGAVRTLAARIKDRALARLDEHLERFIAGFEGRGGQVHYAGSRDEARAIVLDLCRQAEARRPVTADPGPLRVVKVKSMATEEIHLNHVLEAAGLQVTETDLGEFVVQVGQRRPAHIVTPIIDMTRHEVSDLFSQRLNQPRTADPTELTMQARRLLREHFRAADVGISGGNFLVAETGTLVICTNEGNGRMCTTVPGTHIAVVGVEKVVPTWAELAVLLKLLARSGTAQGLTVYTTMVSGPRQPGEVDGPEQVHLVLLDGGRTRVLASETYDEALRCLRCGACLNACPVFRQIGGQPYGGIYSGPIGKVVTPLLDGEQTYCDLPNASSLCGACYEACPVQINIPHLLLELRADQNARGETPLAYRAAMTLWAKALLSPRKYEVGQRVFEWFFGPKADRQGWINELPMARGWTDVRDFPAPAEKSFRQLWRETEGRLS